MVAAALFQIGFIFAQMCPEKNGIIVTGSTATNRHSFKSIRNFQVLLKFEASLLPFPVRLSKLEILTGLRAPPETIRRLINEKRKKETD